MPRSASSKALRASLTAATDRHEQGGAAIRDRTIRAMMATRPTSKPRAHAGSGVPRWRGARAAEFGKVQYPRKGPAKDGTYVDELLSYIVGVGGGAQQYYVHANHLYSPAAITDSSGVVGERMSYDAYGKQTITTATGTLRSQSAVGFDRGFTGYILDGETGLYYARARMYSAGLGRFVGWDPLGYVDGEGLYNGYFVPNATDPSGAITVSTLSFSKLPCGGWSVVYDFKLDAVAPVPPNPAPAGKISGYIVQKLTFQIDSKKCTGGVAENTNETFWEAWPVEAGSRNWNGHPMGQIHVNGKPTSFTDTSSEPSHFNTIGTASASGEVRFYPIKDTGFLGDPIHQVPPPQGGLFGGANQNQQSGILPSTNVQPPWWNNLPPAGEKAGHRKVESDWACCPCIYGPYYYKNNVANSP